jgi:hypothetical protein
MQEAKMVDAHVIPRSFFEAIKSKGKQDYLVMASTETGMFDKRSRIGVYDSTILCSTCEKLFSPWDDYAARLLLSKALPKDILYEDSGRPIARVIASYDYERLMLFFVSLLWRASVSTQPFYSRIKAGPHEEILRQVILRKDLSLNKRVSVLLAQFVNYDDPSQTFFDPYCTRFEHVNFCVFFLATYVAYIKLDKRPLLGSWNEATLKPGKAMAIILRDFRSSSDRHVFGKIAGAIRTRAIAKHMAKNS